jgi:hypothetical protein
VQIKIDCDSGGEAVVDEDEVVEKITKAIENKRYFGG